MKGKRLQTYSAKPSKKQKKNQFNPDWNAINLLSEANFALHKRIAELEAEKAEPSLKVINGEICYKSKQDDQSFGMRCPVGTWCPVNYDSEHGFAEGTKFYTAPPREWVGLSDDEIDEGQKHSWVVKQAFESAVWWAEEKLKEKNHIAAVGKMVALENENAELIKRLEQTAMALSEQVELNKYLEKKNGATS